MADRQDAAMPARCRGTVECVCVPPLRSRRHGTLSSASPQSASGMVGSGMLEAEPTRARARHDVPELVAPRVECGAFARSTGKPCRAPGNGRGGRCRMHGGAPWSLSEEGRRRCSEAGRIGALIGNARRWGWSPEREQSR